MFFCHAICLYRFNIKILIDIFLHVYHFARRCFRRSFLLLSDMGCEYICEGNAQYQSRAQQRDLDRTRSSGSLAWWYAAFQNRSLGVDGCIFESMVLFVPR